MSSDRYQLVGAPPLQPGCCYLCRGTTGPFVDTGVNVKFQGQLYVCANCVNEMADLVGPVEGVPLSVVQKFRDHVREAVTNELNVFVEKMRETAHDTRVLISERNDAFSLGGLGAGDDLDNALVEEYKPGFSGSSVEDGSTSSVEDPAGLSSNSGDGSDAGTGDNKEEEQGLFGV